MAIFNFGHKQRMHTQLYGHTSGNELFKVDEYNQRKKISWSLSLILAGIITFFYFYITKLPPKMLIYSGLVTLALSGWLYVNLKHQRALRQRLY